MQRLRFESSKQLILIASALLSILCLVWVAWLSYRGFDFTDESFYLVWIANPFVYDTSVTQFGFIYHSLYALVGGDIATLRQANLSITFSLSWVLCYMVIVQKSGGQDSPLVERLVISAGVATMALISPVFSGQWLPTPSYNSLALQSLLMAAIGMILAERRVALSSLIGWLLVGLANSILFLAKPTSAALFCVCAGTYFLIGNKFNIRFAVFIAALTIGLIASFGLLIDGSLAAFVARLRGGGAVGEVLGGGHSVAKIISLNKLYLDSRFVLLLASAILVFNLKIFIPGLKRNIVSFSGVMISIGVALIAGVVIFDFWPDSLKYGHFHPPLLLLPFVGFIVLATTSSFVTFGQISRSDWAFILALLLFPFVYAFGTNNNYWVLAFQAGIFWAVLSVVLLRPAQPDSPRVCYLLPIALAAQLFTVFVVHLAVERPYRQPIPLRDQYYSIDIGRDHSRLMVSEVVGQYLAQVDATAGRAGFKLGTPMLDLSGATPGIPYFLGAKSIGQAWMIGGYIGSNRLAVEVLRKVSCQELGAAWLLTEPTGPNRISSEVLLTFGANLTKDYEMVGSLQAPAIDGKPANQRLQQLFRPSRQAEIAVSACAEARAGEP